MAQLVQCLVFDLADALAGVRLRSPHASSSIKRRPVAKRVAEPMKHELNVISMHRISAFRLDPTLTSEGAIVLRTLAAGQTDRQVCNELEIHAVTPAGWCSR